MSNGTKMVSLLTTPGLIALPYLTFEVRESTSISLFGLFRYDVGSDIVKIVQVDKLIGGGLTELKKSLSEGLDFCWKKQTKFLGILAFTLAVSFTALYLGRVPIMQYFERKKAV